MIAPDVLHIVHRARDVARHQQYDQYELKSCGQALTLSSVFNPL